LSVHRSAFHQHPLDDTKGGGFAKKKFFRRKLMDDVIEAQTLHLRPVVEPLEKFLIALVDELFVSSLCHNCKIIKKSL